VRFGVLVPHFGDYADPRLLVAVARDAEAAGWDGIFLWDHLLMDVSHPPPQTDAWIALAAIAASTERIRLGPMVTPLPRRHPWRVARESAALDHLSGGRVVLGVGIGEPGGAEFAAFGEEDDARVRARKLDESLEILRGLWSGTRYTFSGSYYRLTDVTFTPAPLQTPRIPVWVAGQLPHARPLRRAARWDGYFPIADGGMRAPTVDEIRSVVVSLAALRGSVDGFDVVVSGEASGRGATARYEAAGATWWLEQVHSFRGDLAAMRELVRAGPRRA
jgi:alkanesulfonate monooxygenase SsuD/methylene tetrahydromethanopterin reductase-like flavin-dependent oxidoreductase (luciferase family)